MRFRKTSHGVAESEQQETAALRQRIEISLKLWKKEWMHLEKFNEASTENFVKLVDAIQRAGLDPASLPSGGKVVHPSTIANMKKIYPKNHCGECYQFKLGSKGRVYLANAADEGQKMYLLYVDPNHKMCP